MRIFVRSLLLCFLIFSVLGPSQAMGQFFASEHVLVGEKAPDFTLEMVSGKKASLTKFRKGNAAIIFFWATWCPHCRTQLRELWAESSAIEKKGIKIVLVDIEEGAPQVRSYLEKYGIEFDVFLDQASSVAGKYSIIGVPTFFFIDKSGVVQAVEHAIPENYEEILLARGTGPR